MKSIFRYPGSKWSIAEWIISHFPADYPKMVYLEPYCGSSAVFFNKQPGVVETINDLDGDVVNLFRVLREQPEDLKRVLELTPYSREEYVRSFEPCEDPVEKARRFMVKTTQALGAKICRNSGWRNHKNMRIGGTACKWGGIADTICIAAARLRGSTTNLIQIENMDALKLIDRYDSPDVLMYLDPPYVRSSRKSGALYSHEMRDSEHEDLLKRITRSRAKIILSGYPSYLYDRYLQGWHTDSTVSRTTSTAIAREFIWMNYDPPAEQLEIVGI